MYRCLKTETKLVVLMFCCCFFLEKELAPVQGLAEGAFYMFLYSYAITAR